MKRWIVIGAALVALGIPAAYAASPSGSGSQASTTMQSSDDQAEKACKAELTSMGESAFRKKYGTNKNQRNAFGKCVSSKSKDDDDENEAKDDDDKGGAGGNATKCKAERASMGAEAFAKKYGTNHNLKNAFGKCVSSKSKSKTKDKDDKDD